MSLKKLVQLTYDFITSLDLPQKEKEEKLQTILDYLNYVNLHKKD